MITSNHWTILLALFPIIGTAQTVTTFDSRTNGAAIVSAYPALDIGVIDNLDTFGWMRSWSAPALIETDLRIGAAITGTVAQAEADLNAAISNALPATARLRGQDRREVAKQARTNASAANSVPALRAEVARLAELVEAMLEERDR